MWSLFSYIVADQDINIAGQRATPTVRTRDVDWDRRLDHKRSAKLRRFQGIPWYGAGRQGGAGPMLRRATLSPDGASDEPMTA
jgi:hypothetical protein